MLRAVGMVVAINKHYHVNHFIMANILNDKMKVIPPKVKGADGKIVG